MFLDRLASTRTVVVPFTPSTYDDAFEDRLVTLATNMSTGKAESIPIVYICTRVVSEDIAKVALHIYEDLGIDAKGQKLGRRNAPDHEWYVPLHHESNEFQTAIDFREMMTAWALNRGRGVARRRRRRIGGTVRRELEPLHPDLLTHEAVGTRDERWLYYNPRNGSTETLLPDEVFVLWGPRRRSVISFLRELLAIMAANQDLQGQTRKRGPRHTGVIQRPKEAPKWNDKARSNFRRAIDEYMGEGERAGRPLLLEDGMTWLNSSLSFEDMEFLATYQFDNALVCGAYRVPQHKAGLLERSTNNNIAQQAVDYVVDCLLAWAVRWEQSLRTQLLIDPFRAEHNLRTLLRGDPKTAAETHGIYLAFGTELRNEVRDDEGRNPIDGGWDQQVPLNMGQPGANVPGTNVALDIGSPMLKAIVDGGTAPAAQRASQHLRALVRHQASRVVRKELSAVAKIVDRSTDALETDVRAFFHDHTDFVAREMRIDEERAAAYCADRCAAVLTDPAAVDEAATIADLTAIALDERVPEGSAA